ncbi:D-inositol-3-phosphate glycosyltransferase [Gemmata obscuriglobus]|uniref:Glycosyl transferase family 1 domain-containing protein n=1 Tax=Gemmata obscuriglobus TaxID=114 RepID=A0A2Z3GQG7_9BACT|nr:glycosyltransferase family 4 protein [Gemmata obscuriglobus]AWM36073.1 hypothetical protein C1280_02975 [Gemmata obscuriglobus]QEG31349.1 D-inositol-3-phosphate glycosyltransferase [Gemmata obscuriglobus]VTS10689.1 hexosyltransferase : Glycosyltransferase OS=Methanocella conradii (strain DSM 24694 / JCM 17849 / CGMCC 1.5162 / HZ254) GN=Mtc_0611 PE=4 SV=1: Glycos_transf_1 [Gemmata obscuriglobus UQM 2246]
MSKVALVVQRSHPTIVGGSEALAWVYAELLRDRFAVEILTSTALDYVTWRSELPEGAETRDGVTVRRFAPARERTDYWHRLNARLARDYKAATVPGAPSQLDGPWTLPMQEEYIRRQGPDCPGLYRHLEAHAHEYQALLFVTYLYPTSYFGLAHAPADRSWLVPTLHDEPTAYLSAYRHMARRVRGALWLTAPEREIGHALWGEIPGLLVAMPVVTEPAAPASGTPYLLYCGRIDEAKGCRELLEMFERFRLKHPNRLRLVLVGAEHMTGIRGRPGVEYRGVVSDAEKFSLMAGATAVVMPSAYESFSLATLEALAQRTPVLVNEACAVLADHARVSGGGLAYRGAEPFVAGLEQILAEPDPRRRWGDPGRDYVLARYHPDRVRDALVDELTGTGGPRRAG